jgi:ferredoxin-NADP reductase/predicted pyridoxine 5'-phosphate oxidase superfamily flavin-nucleotide-binding protein
VGHKFAELVFTPTVRKLQVKAGSRDSYAAMDNGPDYNQKLTERETTFIGARDSFYMASVSETNWPYLQHRGGSKGFVKVLNDQTIGFADFSGNRQYVSSGNFQHNDRVALFFMDYPNQRRLKMLGRVNQLTHQQAATLSDPDYAATLEGGYIIHIEAFDWNCPQHITPRYTENELRTVERARPTEVTRLPSIPAKQTESMNIGPLELVVRSMRQLTPTIRSYELASPQGGVLPNASAGSHIRIPARLSDGTLIDREYSITRSTTEHYEVAVQLEALGRGGSAAVHDNYSLGTRISISTPINLFPLTPTKEPVVLIAGGIGITPIQSMAIQLEREGTAFSMHYAGRHRNEMAYLAELEMSLKEKLHTYVSSENSKLDIEALLKSVAVNTFVYACGPDRLINDVRTTAQSLDWDPNRICFEKFS